VLVLIGGYFAASELALVSLRTSQVQLLATSGRRGARVAALRQDSNRFLAAVQIGVTLAGFLSAAVGGATMLVVTAVISYVSLVLGELVPKRLALQKPEAVSMFVAPTLDRLATAARPVIWLLSRSTNAVVRLLGLDPHAGGDEVSEEELRDLVGSHRDLTPDERRVLSDVFSATDRRIREVMVPRTDVKFLAGKTTLDDAARQVMSMPHSRYPVTGDDIDDVLGFVHVRDLLSAVHADTQAQARKVADLVRPIIAVPGTKPLMPTLMELRRGGDHLALVVDEYGGTNGIVTLEDLVEELLGEMQDEYDMHFAVDVAAANTFEFEAGLRTNDIAERIGVSLPPGHYETLGGFVMDRLGRVPVVGDIVDEGGHRFTVTQAQGRRPVMVRITPIADDPTGRPAPA